MSLPIRKGDHDRGRKSDIAFFQRLINMAFGKHRISVDGFYGENMAARLVELGVADPAEDPARAGAQITGNVAGRLIEKAIDTRIKAAIAGIAPADADVHELERRVDQILEGLRVAIEG